MAQDINTTLDDVFKNSTPLGSISNSIGETFYGISQRRQQSAVPINRDDFGLTFFVRPQLNLSDFNLRPERKFTPLMTLEPASIQRIIRCLLDPRLTEFNPAFKSPFVDQQNAFIPILTNHLISCTGWPDSTVNSFTSKEGVYKEQFGFVDSVVEEFGSFDLTTTYRNMSGDPISLLFSVWQRYCSNVFQGVMSPYPDYITNNELDYTTRIYRLVLDKNKRYVQKIAATGACYPISVPNGASFNFDSDKPFNMSNENIPIIFKCFGYTYCDDILIHEFNRTVQIFNPSMADEYITSNMVKIPFEALDLFKNKGYPKIDPKTYELNWYISKDEYVRIFGSYERHFEALNENRSQDNQVPDLTLPSVEQIQQDSIIRV